MFELDRRIETLDENVNKTIRMLTATDTLESAEEALEGLEETVMEPPSNNETAAETKTPNP